MGGTSVTLLGPRHRPLDDQAAISDWIPGSLAVIASDSARWATSFARPVVGLELRRRWQSMLESDPELARSDRDLRAAQADEQALYDVRLRHASAAVTDLMRGPGSSRRRDAELEDAIAGVGRLDRRHLDAMNGLRAEFLLRLAGRDDLGRHRREIADVLARTVGLVVAGGHVGELLHTLSIFDLRAMITGPVVAWSAGAMALGPRVLLFHDHDVAGAQVPQFYAGGLQLLPDVVVLPDTRSRLDLHDRRRARWLTARLLPQRAVLLEGRDRIVITKDDHGSA